MIISCRFSVDFVQVLGPTKPKPEPRKVKEVEIIEAPMTRTRAGGKNRTKLSVVHSTTSGHASNTRELHVLMMRDSFSVKGNFKKLNNNSIYVYDPLFVL